jgi:glycosyltransferase involved in cell wall biosynthesis
MNELKISVVTACYNQATTIERTVKSVLEQNYQNLEYIIIDGASPDATLEILRPYQNGIEVLVSEPDGGQYHAIQKGLSLATGEVMAWLNGDDLYYPWTFKLVNQIFTDFPAVDWIIGLPSFVEENDIVYKIASQMAGYPREWIKNGWYSEKLGGFLQQESMFWRKSLWDKSAQLDTTLSLAADFKLWTEFAKHAELTSVSVPLAMFRTLPGIQRSSAQRDGYNNEVVEVCANLPQAPRLWKYLSQKGIVYRSFVRWFLHSRAAYISYNRESRKWRHRRGVLPISRAGLAELVLENSLRTTDRVK